MAEPKDLLSKLSDAGEDAIAKVSEMPGASRVSNAFSAMRDRMDEMQRRVRGLEDVERRLAALEKRVDELAKAKPTRARRTTGARASTARKSTSRKSSSS